jgi:hypothetical protein
VNFGMNAAVEHFVPNVCLQSGICSVQSGYSSQQIAKTWASLGPELGLRKSRGIGQSLSGEGAVFCCKSVIDSGSSAGTTPDDKLPDRESVPKPEGRVEDGSILTGDGSELRSTVRLVECAMLAATAGLAYFLSNLLRLEVCFLSVAAYLELSCPVLFEVFVKFNVWSLGYVQAAPQVHG